MMAKVCLVDDEELMRDSVAAILKRQGHAVEAFDDPHDALEAARGGSFDVLVTDLKMPNMTGVDLLRGVRTAGCDTPTILMTAFATVGTAVEAMKLGAYDYIQKPFDGEEICTLIERTCSTPAASENEALRRAADASHRPAPWSDPGAMRRRAQADRPVAGSDATVLIHGRNRHRQGVGRARDPRRQPRPDRPHARGQLRRPAARRCWKANCSATRRAPSPAPIAVRKRPLRAGRRRHALPRRDRRDAARRSRRSCCACCRSASSSASAAVSPARSTSASSPRPTAT